jgi:adenosylmethionine-8-amino-7-oxononanoate aminotransferase
MRHFLADWNQWTIAERITAISLAVAALMSDRVALFPPLITTADQLDEIFRRFTRALDDTAAMVRDKGLVAAA